MHGLAEVDGVENLDAVRFINHLPLGVPQRLSMLVPLGCVALEQIAAFHQDGALGEDVVKIFKGNIFQIFTSEIGVFNIIQHQTLHFVLQSVFCGLATVECGNG